MAKKGKGLTPEELTVFSENEAFWAGDYFKYMKSLTNPRDSELAQLRRRFQSSFRLLSPDHFSFKFVFSQPSEVPPAIPPVLFLEITIDSRFPAQVAQVKILNEDMRERDRTGVETAVQHSCADFGSFWRVIRSLDTRISEMYAWAMQPRVEVDETPPTTAEESKAEAPPSNPLLFEPATDTAPPPAVSDQAKLRISKAPVVTFTATTQFIMLRSVGTASCVGFSLAVNCSRCRQLEDITLQPDTTLETFSGSSECRNCHQAVLTDFTPAILHENNLTNLGEVKSQGCTPLRVLYVNYKLACVGCSADTESGPLGILEKYSGNCRECQGKMAFSVGQVEFATDAGDGEKTHKRGKQKLQIVLGQPLPMNGACKHYKQSFRWFRFRCCQNVFPCDKCHEEQSEPHEFDRSEFMLCGFCSTEQKIGNIVTCVKCKAAVTEGSAGEKRFWEGGKGCRNQTLMSKNDRRKHRK